MGLCWPAIGLLFFLYLLTGWQLLQQVEQRALDKVAATGVHQLRLYASHLQGELQRFEKLPGLIATHPRLLQVLQDPDDVEAVEGLNHYLQEINSTSGGADIYLMDRSGLTLAASNWQGERPFVGRNFSFRPYFQQAMEGRLGRYFALGTTSRQRGYYFASAVWGGGEIFGVVVVKVNLSNIESGWEGLSEELLVTDPDGVIFIATNPAWRFKTTAPLDAEQRQRVEQSRRYPQMPLPALGWGGLKPRGEGAQLVSVPGYPQRYLLQSNEMVRVGWKIHLMTPLLHVEEQINDALLLFALLSLALLSIGLGLRQRHQRRVEKRHYDQRARDALYQAHAELEQRVKDRTADLSMINEQLSREIEERRQAERQLRATQNELVQAEKLATLGQMSAGINHELSQPLAAIRSYADNGRALLQQQRLDEVAGNLSQISDLTERMARIGEQLKIFSRKSSGQKVLLSLRAVVETAVSIIQPRSEQLGVELEQRLPAESHQVLADEVLLQQVLVNLIHNALQAVEEVELRRVRISSTEDGERTVLVVEDSGRGIAEEHMEQIFTPFFTTKSASEGLGLGLTISSRIVDGLGGELRVAASELGGARFEVVLPNDQSVEVDNAVE